MAGNRYFLAIPLLAILAGWYLFIAKSATIEFSKGNLPPFAQLILTKEYEIRSTQSIYNSSGSTIFAAIPYRYNGEPYIVTIELTNIKRNNFLESAYYINLYNIYGELEKTLYNLTDFPPLISGDIYWYNVGEKLVITLPFILFGQPYRKVELYTVIIDNKSVIKFEKEVTIENVTDTPARLIGTALYDELGGKYIFYIYYTTKSNLNDIVKVCEGEPTNITCTEYPYAHHGQVTPMIYETKDYIYFGYILEDGRYVIKSFNKHNGIVKTLISGQLQLQPGEYVGYKWNPLRGDYNRNIVYFHVIGQPQSHIIIGNNLYTVSTIFGGKRIFVYDNKIMNLHEGYYPEMNVTVDIFNYTVTPNGINIQKIGSGVLFNSKEEGLWLGNYSHGSHDILPQYHEVLYTSKSYLVATETASEWASEGGQDYFRSVGRSYVGLLVIDPLNNVYSLKPIYEHYGYWFSNYTSREYKGKNFYYVTARFYGHPHYVILLHSYNYSHESGSTYYYVKSMVYVLTSKEITKPQPQPTPTPTPRPSGGAAPTKPKVEEKPVTNVTTNVTYPGVQAVTPISPNMLVLIGFLVAVLVILYFYYTGRR